MDLDLRINGSATSAVAAFTETAAAAQELGGATEDLGGQWKKLEAQENAQAASLANVKAGFLAVGAAVLKFSADSVKAYADAERIQKQLERAAGDLSDAFSAQADALEASLNIDGELIKQQQTLLLQWGAAPSAIAPTIKAIEDYAAATGKDALTATTELIKGVETGGAKFKALGVQYEETGDKTKDLAALTQGLADKFGGAAGVNAASLSGRINAVDVAFGNLKESFGGVIAAMESKTGVLDKVANALQRISRGIGGQKDLAGSLLAMTPAGIATSLLTSQGDAAAAPDIVDPQVGSTGPTGIHLAGFKPYDGSKGSGSHLKSMQELNDKSLEETKKYYADLDQLEATAAAQEELAFANALAAEGKSVHDTIELRRSGEKAYNEIRLSEEKKAAEHNEKLAQDKAKAEEKAIKDSVERSKKTADEAKRAGDQIGGALVNAIADQLSKLAEGGEFDAALFIGDILATAVGVAATVIGTAYGMPVLGAAVGNLAGMGIRAGASALSTSAKRGRARTYHSGGWVGDEAELPRYHSGAWIAPDEQQAILQRGERVMSRAEVHHMGGPGAVENMVKGGGPRVVVNVSALDAKSAAESFESEVGKGLRQALRSGRGDVPSLFGMGGPR